MSGVILPGATLGMLGSGQLGRMFTFAAHAMGYRVHVFSPDADSPAGAVADQEIVADYNDLDAVRKFAQSVDVVSLEFENIPRDTLLAAEEFAPVRPGPEVLHVAQNRLREKSTLSAAGLPVTPFASVQSVEELQAAVQELGLPGVLKTASWGYDGKGQIKLTEESNLADAWRELDTDAAIYEKFINFRMEISVVGARGLTGEFQAFGPIENAHRNHILDVSTVPATASDDVAKQATSITRGVMEALNCIGVLCVEFFLTADDQLMINEIAPRPHNSGHLTIEAYRTSQFEQQVRAICGLPLGSTELISPSAMVNLLGDVWENGPPHWDAALKNPDLKLHLYGKQEARPGRKMGHMTVLADSAETAAKAALAARESLAQPVERLQ
ncbi:5-(carboxyamino)imidazole ribonucleotide synthase [Calycomorphotria hydatis]|uniref:N5-carboxyaminoimidazole ribonucleotide synthase n=1 Tax=Calycomorphotria hydatis TaxID=2528027 RepID=A0A517T928_9PLAN|nr:5-(carboxyamino)imidazole ribonucleotide synthase [Calycomorphotria hydatis]QDT64867.1 N5-carboxyaminoimidazole ribonucleotide synthase [Calycomorphotria hydatis]